MVVQNFILSTCLKQNLIQQTQKNIQFLENEGFSIGLKSQKLMKRGSFLITDKRILRLRVGEKDKQNDDFNNVLLCSSSE